MLIKVKNYIPFFCLVLFIVLCASARAEDMNAIKARMLQRKPTIDALKQSGAVGEGVDGYLHVRQAKGNAANIVAAENADRQKVNTMIAQQEGATVEQVSRKVAATIINSSPRGHWIRKQDGTWYQK
jgi:uncharacterized protein YdbL (DUF1318 family)